MRKIEEKITCLKKKKRQTCTDKKKGLNFARISEAIDIAIYLDLIITLTANALARKIAGIYFTREDRLSCNIKEAHRHHSLDPLRVAKVKSLFLNIMGTKAEDMSGQGHSLQ